MVNPPRNEVTSSRESTLPDGHFAIEASDTYRIIVEEFNIILCGLFEVQQGAKKVVKRLTKPLFTYECSQEIMSRIYVAVNRVTGRTTYTEQELLNFNIATYDAMTTWFTSVAFHLLVSDRAWKVCMELAKPHVDEVTGDIIKVDFDGETFVENDWYTKYGIRWQYDYPFNNDMLTIIKSDFGLEQESFAQDVIMDDLCLRIQTFIHGGLARSKNALTLEHEKVIYKETHTGPEQNPNGPAEGFIDKVKRGIRGFLPG